MINDFHAEIHSISTNFDVEIDFLREDLNHPYISGNKLRKLKYNLIEAKNQTQNALLTFGGAFSNHIYAVAAAGKEFGFETIGIIRGEELENKPLNPTLAFAKSCGMQLHFIPREEYKNKENVDFINDLKEKFGKFYLIPEGGTNNLAVKGCEEILNEKTKKYDFICCPIGTAGTISGIIKTSEPHQKILGFPALKNADFLKSTIENYTEKKNYEFINAYHFGGYGKINVELLSFVHEFYEKHEIPLDFLYNGKMVFGIFDLLMKNKFPKNSKILIVHTGGLQGNEGFNSMKGN